MLPAAKDKQAYIDMAFVAQNYSNIDTHFGIPYADHPVGMRILTGFEIVSLLWDVTQRRLVIYGRCGTTSPSHLNELSSLIGCPETSLNNYQSMLRNITEERRSRSHRGESLKTRIRRIRLISGELL